MPRKIRIALIGAGMFGGDVHLRTYSQLQRSGLAPWLGRIGLDDLARPFADIEVELVAVATRTEKSASALRASSSQEDFSFQTYHGPSPWVDVLEDFPDLDILAVATPDHLHAATGSSRWTIKVVATAFPWTRCRNKI